LPRPDVLLFYPPSFLVVAVVVFVVADLSFFLLVVVVAVVVDLYLFRWRMWFLLFFRILFFLIFLFIFLSFSCWFFTLRDCNVVITITPFVSRSRFEYVVAPSTSVYDKLVFVIARRNVEGDLETRGSLRMGEGFRYPLIEGSGDRYAVGIVLPEESRHLKKR